MSKGRIELIHGPMFSGKSTELKRRINRYIIPYKNIVIFKNKIDTRFDPDHVITHNKEILTNVIHILCSTIKEGFDKYLSTYGIPDIVGIDEGQFFPDLVNTCESLANSDIIVIIAMLDGKWNRCPWIGNEILKDHNYLPLYHIYSIADQSIKLYAFCNICKKENAPFSKNIKSQNDVELGGSEKYMAVCRTCYYL